MTSVQNNTTEEIQAEKSDHDIIYALRTVHQNQTQLLILADQKANVLIGIVAVILTLLFTNATFLKSIDRSLLVPLICFVLIEVIALFFALLVIMPKNAGKLDHARIEDIPNPFFFGFFTRFEQSEYISYLSENMDDDASARQFLSKDLYQIGLVLKRKYTFLKCAYTLAVSGIICLGLLSMITFFFSE